MKKRPFRDQKQVLEQINKLYVMSRMTFLTMYKDKNNQVRYNTVTAKNKSDKAHMLNDRHIVSHINKEKTIGVFAGKQLTKFLCFDVDTSELTQSKGITYALVNTLIEDFNVPEKYINVSFSGSKGYHVELFFSKEAISNQVIKQFYERVVHSLGSFENGNKVELRPTASQGVKIPLSNHLKTGHECCYVDTITLEPITDAYHILSIEQMDVEEFKEKVLDRETAFSLPYDKATEIETVLQATNIKNKKKSEYQMDIVSILRNEALIRDGSRNDVTFKASMFLKDMGNTEQDTIDQIKQLLDNTWQKSRHLISEDTTYQFMMDEVDRITHNVYEKNMSLGEVPTHIKIYKCEIEQILEQNKLQHKKLLFSMLVHSRKYAKHDGSFYMAYSVMTKMGNTTERGRLLKTIMDLQEDKLVKILRQNETSRALTIEANKYRVTGEPYRKISETNSYQVIMKQSTAEEEPYMTLNTGEEIDMAKVVVTLIPEKKAKKILPRRQWQNTFREAYRQII